MQVRKIKGYKSTKPGLDIGRKEVHPVQPVPALRGARALQRFFPVPMSGYLSWDSKRYSRHCLISVQIRRLAPQQCPQRVREMRTAIATNRNVRCRWRGIVAEIRIGLRGSSKRTGPSRLRRKFGAIAEQRGELPLAFSIAPGSRAKA